MIYLNAGTLFSEFLNIGRNFRYVCYLTYRAMSTWQDVLQSMTSAKSLKYIS